jgi:hypothetical protein
VEKVETVKINEIKALRDELFSFFRSRDNDYEYNRSELIFDQAMYDESTTLLDIYNFDKNLPNTMKYKADIQTSEYLSNRSKGPDFWKEIKSVRDSA